MVIGCRFWSGQSAVLDPKNPAAKTIWRRFYFVLISLHLHLSIIKDSENCLFSSFRYKESPKDSFVLARSLAFCLSIQVNSEWKRSSCAGQYSFCLHKQCHNMDGLARAFALRLAGFDSFRCPQGICSILAFLFWLIFADLSWRNKEKKNGSVDRMIDKGSFRSVSGFGMAGLSSSRFCKAVLAYHFMLPAKRLVSGLGRKKTRTLRLYRVFPQKSDRKSSFWCSLIFWLFSCVFG